METIVFYGTRGSTSLTSDRYFEFGGATTCLLLHLGNANIMVDCGSGVNNALDDLKEIEELHLFISHSHIDHLCGVPTLLSAFADKKLHVYAKPIGGVTVRESIGRIMDQSLWPVRADAYQNVTFHEIGDDVTVGDVRVKTMDSNHPGGCTLFRFSDGKSDVVTAFDFCHLNGYEEKLCAFAKGCTALIYDGTMSEDEVLEKPNWGHSTPEAGARIGEKIGCPEVYITHFGYFDDRTLTDWEAKIRKDHPNVRFARSGKRKNDFQKMVDIGALLTYEKDGDALLTKIVEACMDITNADGGTLYLLEKDKLEFKVLISHSKNTLLVRKDAPLGIPSVAIEGKNACAAAAREKKLINIEDAYAESTYDFSGSKEYDRRNGYRTKSVLVVPMIDEYDDVVGVLQLINASDSAGKIVSFPKDGEDVLSAIANQASMAIVNSSYSAKINDLLYGFVKVMSLGIDERTPYNANHTRNMVAFANRFFDYEESIGGPYRVDDKKRREILMGIWLHDIGKILTPIDIMNKDSRLGAGIREIEYRFERRELLLRLFFAEGKLSKEAFDAEEETRKRQLETVRFIDRAGFLTDDLKAKVDALAAETYQEADGSVRPILTNGEIYQLSIVKGTLNKEERNVMEGHVSLTQRILSQLQFPKYYDQIPQYAGNHHEMLDGSGYPNHLTEKDLPWPCRLITVCDIFEALTAKDRPYKKPMSPERSFSILYEMADQGKLDRKVICEFEQSDAWQS